MSFADVETLREVDRRQPDECRSGRSTARPPGGRDHEGRGRRARRVRADRARRAFRRRHALRRHPSDAETPIVIAALDPPEEPQFVFYREPAAPDSTILPGEVDLRIVREAPILWVSASAHSPSSRREEPFAQCSRSERRRHTTILDLDYRPSFWRDRGRGPQGDRRHRRGGHDRGRQPRGVRDRRRHGDPEAAAGALLERGVEIAIVKLGGERCPRRDRGRAATSCPVSRSTSSAALVPAMRSVARSATHSSSACRRPRPSSSQTRPARSSPRGCSAPMRCRPSRRSELAGRQPVPELSCSPPAPLPTATTRCS